MNNLCFIVAYLANMPDIAIELDVSQLTAVFDYDYSYILCDPWGAAISATAQLITDIFNAASANKNRKLQVSLMREQNAFNERMMDKQYQNELEMWNLNNDYNDAVSQAERWREAGFNPYMMMNNSSSGIASGSTSASASGANVPQTQPTQIHLGEAVANMMNYLNQSKLIEAQARKATAEAEGAEIDNDTREIINRHRVNLLYHNSIEAGNKSDYWKYHSGIEKNNLYFSNETMNNRISRDAMETNMAVEKMNLLSSQSAISKLSLDKQRYLNQYVPVEQQLSMGMMMMQILEREKNIKLAEYQCKKLFQEIVKVKNENDVFSATKKEFVQSLIDEYKALSAKSTRTATEEEWNLKNFNITRGLEKSGIKFIDDSLETFYHLWYGLPQLINPYTESVGNLFGGNNK